MGAAIKGNTGDGRTSGEYYYIGIQGAGRNAMLVAADQHGTIKTALRFGPLALRVNADFRRDFLSALNQLAAKLDLRSLEALAGQTKCACIAMSGIREPSDAYAVSQVLEEIWFTGNFSKLIYEDVWAILGAAGTDNGCAILASTGANVFIRNSRGKSVSVGGWGSDLADLGSGYHIGKQALNLVLDSSDGRRSASPRFVEAVLQALQLGFPSQIVPWYHEVRRTSHWRPKIADLATTVTELAQGKTGFEDARHLLDLASRELSNSIVAAFQQARKQKLLELDKTFRIVFDGGVLRRDAYYRGRIEAQLRSAKFRADTKCNLAKISAAPLQHHPVIGAVAFAISGKRQLPSRRIYDRLVESAQQFPELTL